jgi:hypothetical protein
MSLDRLVFHAEDFVINNSTLFVCRRDTEVIAEKRKRNQRKGCESDIESYHTAVVLMSVHL